MEDSEQVSRRFPARFNEKYWSKKSEKPRQKNKT